MLKPVSTTAGQDHFDSTYSRSLIRQRVAGRGHKPQLYYQWMGDAFDTPAKVNQRKTWVIEACLEAVKPFPNAGFDCKKDISFKVLSEVIDPLTTKGK